MFSKELRYYFSTPIAYIVIGLYLLSVSLFLWVLPGQWNVVESGYAQCDGLFMLSPWLMMLLCPAITMRLFAEERRSGIWNLLLTRPYPLWRIVLDKYLAAWVIVLIGLLPNIVHYFLVAYIAEPTGNLDFGQFMGAYIGLILLSGAYLAIGLVAASFSKSQIVCFILGALACFAFYWLSMQAHYESLSRGVIDLRDVCYFLGVDLVGLVFSYDTHRIIKRYPQLS